MKQVKLEYSEHGNYYRVLIIQIQDWQARTITKVTLKISVAISQVLPKNENVSCKLKKTENISCQITS